MVPQGALGPEMLARGCDLSPAAASGLLGGAGLCGSVGAQLADAVQLGGDGGQLLPALVAGTLDRDYEILRVACRLFRRPWHHRRQRRGIGNILSIRIPQAPRRLIPRGQEWS